jgi:hypothetical protein
MLQKHAHYNDLSAELRKELEDQIDSFGKRVRFKFHISHDNPDPEKYNGPTIWPFLYVLQPRVFRINDPYEKRTGESKSKNIGLVIGTDKDGKPEKFDRIRVNERHKGILSFELLDENNQPRQDERDLVMYLLVHPKMIGGKFKAPDAQGVFELIDVQKEAKAQREMRKSKGEALAIATKMTDNEVVTFAQAMMWDSTEEVDFIRNRVEEEAENNPKMFVDLVTSKKLEYQSLVKRSLEQQRISFDPVAYNISWFGNQQLIATLSPVGDKNEVQKFAEWLETGGKKADEVFNKLKSLDKTN